MADNLLVVTEMHKFKRFLRRSDWHVLRHFRNALTIIAFSIFLGIAMVESNAYSAELSVGANDDLNLSAQDLQTLTVQALEGSGAAANKLSTYYLFVKYDNKEGLYWVTISAENGDIHGFHNLGMLLSEEKNNPSAQARARYWLTKAANAGDQDALSTLDQMNENK
jgi:TPR repeat protein